MPFANLLHFARIIQAHQFDLPGILEVGDRRIVESQVAVFANAEAAEVDGLCLEQFRVSFAFIEGQQGFPLDVVKFFGLEFVSTRSRM